MPSDTPPPQRDNLTDIDPHKLMAALSYVGVLVFVPFFLEREDPFVNFHVKQGFVILAGFVIALLAVAWLSVLGNLLFLLMLVASVAGFVQAMAGRRWKIPAI
ncbi:MAG: hypothetical protein ACREQV_13395, partial [Candidatus Binatia bacterium]